ncbi:DUF4054 domain-containing protein [[Haemophilus] felis]|uniref:DUF4054 domain-containing protein n=1 Tax=[Haemophilus] felis TaxID=123822 RepID=A0A1T0B260_9PAST|nr:DUF4054 domain-containing protein [[Haemophilus] felis]OOS04162.1 hypothetical protein B0188_05735 [[Haemophilus] felis]
MPLPQRFLARYPEFEETDSEKIGLFVEDAKAEISEKHWGRLYERGVMALAAHLLALNKQAQHSQGGAIRPVSAESAGELSASYAMSIATSSLDEFYQTTAYGQEFLRLRKLVGVGVMVV